ncbi:MAG TPA: phospholipase D-like domain-containing protein [Patescibacteria group bacterium]|nr:phospholipase D-like domain-containing protein [Patescibacteria group bacterium]
MIESVVNLKQADSVLGEKAETGVELMNLKSVIEEIHQKLQQDDIEVIILQSRQFEAGTRCTPFYHDLSEKKCKTIVNVDSSARKEFEKGFPADGINGDGFVIRFTHEKYSNIPIINKYVGRNHVRIIMLGETAYLSSFDFAEPSFNRDELFMKITQPEIVQMLKIVSFWDYSKEKKSWNQKAGDLELVFDTGKSSAGVLSRYADQKLHENLNASSNLWVVSSWCPDELNDTVNFASSRGSNINLLVNRQYEWESLKKIPFNITKILSNNEFRSSTKNSILKIFNPTGKQIHAKFILTENQGKYWWFVGTSNHTKFGSKALTTEIGISGEDQSIGDQLINYIESTEKVEV